MIIIKKVRSVPVLLAILIGLTGCNMRISPEELIQPPKLFEKDEVISKMIEENLPKDAKLENIKSAEGLSAVKKKDINGNGVDEILVFYSTEDETRLNMIVFEEKDGAYEKSVEAEVPGSFFEKVLTEDITGDGYKELILSTSEKRSQDGSYKMSIYSYDKEPNKFFEIDYSKYLLHDLNEDENADIIILNQEERTVSVDYYSYNQESEQMEFENETILDKINVSDMTIADTDSGKVKILLEFENDSEEDSERIFLSLDENGKLKSEEE